MSTDVGGASIVMHRRLAWNETDAAGHNHFSAAFRWMEEAEHSLFDCLGLSEEMIDRLPRVHIDIDYSARVLYGEELIVRVGVAKVGGSSCTFSYTVDKADGSRAVTASYVVVHVSSTTEGGAPWPDSTREALLSPVEFTVRQEVVSSAR